MSKQRQQERKRKKREERARRKTALLREKIRRANASADALPTTGKSTLLDKTAKLLGFLYDAHPTKAGQWIHCVFYQIGPQEFAIALGELAAGETPEPEAMRPNLGDEMPAELIIPHVERKVEGADFATFKKAMSEAYPHVDIEWYDEQN